MNISKDLLELVKRIKAQKKSPVKILTKRGYSQKEVEEVLDYVISERDKEAVDETPAAPEKPISKKEEDTWGSTLKTNKKYVFNERTGEYIVYLKSAAGYINVSKAKHQAMLRAYSNWNGESKSIEDICRAHQFPRLWFSEYKSIFGWTHDVVPVSDEELAEKTNEELIEDLNIQRKFEINQELERDKWRSEQADAEKWRAYQSKIYDPLDNILAKWTPPEQRSVDELCLMTGREHSVNNATYLIGVTDVHFGAKAILRNSFYREEWNSDMACEAIERYTVQIAEDVNSRNVYFDKAVIAVLGDILHGLRGRTEKGVPLKFDRLNEEQWEIAFTTMTKFFSEMLLIFPKIEVEVVKGNHAGVDDAILFKAIQAYFRNDDRIEFHIHAARTAAFKVRSTLCLIDHGASPEFKALIPRGAVKRENHIQALLLKRPDLLEGTKQKIFLQGDVHHFETKENTSFEFYMFGSPVKGDEYAESMGLSSRPRQNALVIDDDGVKEVLNFYLD